MTFLAFILIVFSILRGYLGRPLLIGLLFMPDSPGLCILFLFVTGALCSKSESVTAAEKQPRKEPKVSPEASLSKQTPRSKPTAPTHG
jgi:hypothetical protein